MFSLHTFKKKQSSLSLLTLDVLFPKLEQVTKMPEAQKHYISFHVLYDSKSASSSSGKGCAAAAASSASYL